MIISFTALKQSNTYLEQKNENILRNAVIGVISIIEVENTFVEKGYVTKEEAIKNVYEKLDEITKTDDYYLGSEGYFVILDQSGNILYHPSLVGTNGFELRDLSNEGKYFVKEQINKAKNGGGFVEFDWYLKDKKTIGTKTVYAKMDPVWGLIIESTAYYVDFNKAHNNLLLSILISIAFALIISFVVLRKLIKGITKPILSVVNGMLEFEKGNYIYVDTLAKDELQILVNGFNNLSRSLREKMEELENEKERYDLVLKSSKEGYWDYNLIEDSISLSERFMELLGINDKTIDFYTLLTRVDNSDVERFKETFSINIRNTIIECKFRMNVIDMKLY
jgi:methyl-accepting chemotaxis protein